MMKAADEGHSDIVRLLINRGAEVNIFAKVVAAHIWHALQRHSPECSVSGLLVAKLKLFSLLVRTMVSKLLSSSFACVLVCVRKRRRPTVGSRKIRAHNVPFFWVISLKTCPQALTHSHCRT